MSAPAILILAAGASARMQGSDKLLEDIAGQPLLRDRALAALSTGATVLAALPPQDAAPARWAALDGLKITLITVSHPQNGMSASLRAGLAALHASVPGLMVLLADMPEISGSDLTALLDRFDGEAILRGASSDGKPGHPVLFPRRDFAALARLGGDQGARDVLKTEADRVRLIPLPAAHALTDLDTQADWARWRALQDEGRKKP
jgi:CTP:molybdopterin cytidylyltransferase MocA